MTIPTVLARLNNASARCGSGGSLRPTTNGGHACCGVSRPTSRRWRVRHWH